MRHPAAALGAALSIVALAGSVLAPASALAKAPAGPPVQQPVVTQPAFLGGSATTQAATPDAAALASGFSDVTVFTGFTEPSKVQFAADGRVFVAEKGGLIKVFSSLSATTPTIYADLRSEVDDYWDRGLLGFALSPNFVNDHTFYVQYGYDHNPVADLSGNPYHAPTQWNDVCPSPPGPTTDGCTILGRISKFTVAPAAGTSLGPANESVLVQGWCQQYPSHSNDDLWIGPDGLLYSTAGEGASFNGPDYGQLGGTSAPVVTPVNPCGDPPSAAGTADTIPTAEGGALRSQSIRRVEGMGAAVLNGAMLRLDSSTGYGVPANPFYTGNGNNNQSRILAFGLRNPFRFTFQPAKNLVWIGDVGDATWEEVDRLPMAPTASNDDFGWPCREGTSDHPGWPSGINPCTSLTNTVDPFYTYNHGSLIADETNCPTANGSSISGLAFYTGTAYPAAYQGALFFGDHTRSCIWAMLPDTNGNPNPATIKVIVNGGAQPVDIETGPNGDLFYVKYDAGELHRLTYGSPQANIKADKTAGPAPLTVNFDGTTSSSPIGATPLTFSWIFPGGVNSTTTSAKPIARSPPARTRCASRSRTPTARPTRARSPRSRPARRRQPPSSTRSTGGAARPADPGRQRQPTRRTPGQRAGLLLGERPDHVRRSRHRPPGGDLAGGRPDLGAAHLPLSVGVPHPRRPDDRGIRRHIPAPDHPYPSLLWLQLTATNAQGLSSSTSVYLYPKTSTFTLNTVPAGLSLGAGTTTGSGPYQATFLLGGSVTLSAPSPQTMGGTTYTFSGWSDGGAADARGHGFGGDGHLHGDVRPGDPTVTYLSDITPTSAVNGWGPSRRT